MGFQPDYRNILDVINNTRSARLPLYEHIIDPEVIEKILNVRFADLLEGGPKDIEEFFEQYCSFFKDMTDDTVSFEVCVTEILPDIAPYDKWIDEYGDRIGLLGGIDVDILCQKTPEEITEIVYDSGRRFRQTANGYALGSGNSIPNYVPVDGYLAMIEAVKRIRAEEN